MTMGNGWWVLIAFMVLLSGSVADTETEPEMEKAKKTKGKLLLFGGNGYIGGETAMQLIDEGYELVLASRGRDWPYDLSETVWPFVRHIVCDRKKPKEGCAELWKYFEEEDPHFLAVIDFSAYKPEAVEPFYDSLRKRTDLYIYISSDSVYEVCDVEVTPERLMFEKEAVRPKDPDQRDRLAKKDDYGHDKLRVEEYLLEKRKEKDSIPYIFLRLPDVIGERDSTDRVWKLLLLIEYFEELEIQVAIPPSSHHLKTSFVYVRDVGSAIRRILAINNQAQESISSSPDSESETNSGGDACSKSESNSASQLNCEPMPKGPIQDEIFNLASDYPQSLPELINTFAEVFFEGNPEKREKFKPTGEPYQLTGDYPFPSVTLGGIESSKIRDALGWKHTEWPEISRNIVNFFHEALREFPAERDWMTESVMKDLGIGKKDSRRRNRFLNAILSRASKRSRDEEEL